MVIIQLAGGLGNQMFQYALYLKLQSLGREVKIDDVTGYKEDPKRHPQLGAFGIDYVRAGEKELERMLDSSMLFFHRVRRKLFGRKRKSYFEEDRFYRPEILEWDDIYLEGYWQTEKYFHDIEKTVREAFDVGRLLSGEPCRQEAVQRYLKSIESTESVSIHVRGGDYLLPQNRELFGGNCTKEYYREAMQRIKELYPECKFYLYTNDLEYARSKIDEKFWRDLTVIGLTVEDDLAEFALMSRCRHNILANSSFSWWASYLNNHTEKKVLAPGRWLNNWDCRDLYREDMEMVE